MGSTAPVNKIIPFSLVDGPGSRTSIFLQGCNIACAYCHNPETQRTCIACGICIERCPAGALVLEEGRILWDENACVGCDTCIRVCPHFATPKIHEMSASEVFARVQSFAPFIRGITVSGGECMLWPDFVKELFSLAQEAGLETLIDSNGTIAFEKYPQLMSVTTGVMLDVKAWDPAVAKALTGQSEELSACVKRNLVYLSEAVKLEELRLVVVPDRNDPEAVLAGCAGLLGERVGACKLKLIRFRPFGVKGKLASAVEPEDALMDKLAVRARAAGFEQVVIT